MDVQAACVNGLIVFAFIAWCARVYFRQRRADFRDNLEAIMQVGPGRLDDLVDDEGFMALFFVRGMRDE